MFLFSRKPKSWLIIVAALALVPSSAYAATDTGYKQAMCDMFEILAENAVSYRIEGMRYTEALAAQRAFIAQGKKLRRDEEAFLERVGNDLVDKAYMTEVPERLANPQNPDDFDAIAFVSRQWAKQQTAWCRR